MRTTEDVFKDHLRLRETGNLEQDLQRNYSTGIVLICSFAVLRGHEAVRKSALRLGLQLPGATFKFTTQRVADEYALLEWEASSESYNVKYGADSFVIRQGKIVMQTIRYTIVPGERSSD